MIFLLYNSNEMYFKKGNNMKIEKKKLFALHFTVWINILKDIKMFVCTLTTQFQSRARVYCTMTFILLQWKIYSFVFILYSSRGSSFSYFLLLSLLSSRVATEEAFRCQIYLFASLLSLFFLLYFIYFFALCFAWMFALSRSSTADIYDDRRAGARRKSTTTSYIARQLLISFPPFQLSYSFLFVWVVSSSSSSSSFLQFVSCLFVFCSLSAVIDDAPSLSSANDDNSDGVQQRAEFSNSLTLSRLTATMKYANDDWAGLGWTELLLARRRWFIVADVTTCATLINIYISVGESLPSQMEPTTKKIKDICALTTKLNWNLKMMKLCGTDALKITQQVNNWLT